MALGNPPAPTRSKESLISRTALQIYLAEHDGQAGVAPFDSLHPSMQGRYDRMAAAALTEAYREPATV